MNKLVNLFFSELNFTNYNREVNIPIFKSKNFDIQDIYFSLYTKPALDPMEQGLALIAPHDFRLYINETNVTTYLIDEIIDQLKSKNNDLLIAAYQQGCQDYMKLAEKMYIDEAKLEEDRQWIIASKDNLNWIDEIKLIGDANFAGSGNLHPCSFLFRYIILEEFSLKSILQRASLQFDEMFINRTINITLSIGPAPSKEEFDPVILTNGKLFLSFKTEVTNPLEKVFKQILSKIKNISRALDKLRQSYLSPIYSLSQQNTNQLEISNASTIESLEKINENIDNLG